MKFGFGEYVNVPSLLSNTEPFVGPVAGTTLIVGLLNPVAEVSFVNTFTVTATSSGVVTASSTATIGSGVTYTTTVCVSQSNGN